MSKNLYRAVRKDNNELVEGSLVIFDDEHVFIMPRVESVSTPDYAQVFQSNAVMVYPDTVCQCTGLTEKNGLKVFEYDKIHDPQENKIYTVKWDKDLASFILEDNNGWMDGVAMKLFYCEVIGNIHCNKEK